MNSKRTAATESISVACSDVKEHKAKPRRRMEGLSGIITPGVHRRGAVQFSAHSSMVGQQPVLCQVSFVQPNL